MMTWVWLVLWGLTVALSVAFRSRGYAAFVAFMLGLQCLVWVGLFAGSRVEMAAASMSAIVFLHFVALIRPKMRSLLYRTLVSWPALWFEAGTLLAAPWAMARALGFTPHGWWLPWAVALVGMAQSLRHRDEEVDLTISQESLPSLRRVPEAAGTGRPLRIAHITDTHLGPFVSEKRLTEAFERVVLQEPDLVLLTGDFMTMESSADPEMIARAFAPLQPIAHRVFACRGNHDLESPDVLAKALRTNGIRLLVDEVVRADTDVGPVDVLGIDFKFRGAAEHIDKVCAAHPRTNAFRVVLLHHPGYFKHLPDGAADLVLSGHTHGGQLGLVDFGINVSMFSLFVRCPDHGFWGLGRNRLYVGRGLGHYGFPLRIGVSAHQVLLNVFAQ